MINLAFRLRELQVGDILRSRDNDRGIYIYLGEYSQYSRDKKERKNGYLYCRLSKYTYDPMCAANYAQKCVNIRVLQQAAYAMTLRNFGKFTKNPVTFEEKIGHVDISGIADAIERLPIFRIEKI